MNDATLLETIDRHFQTYEALQHRHLDMLKSQNRPDIGGMARERKTVSDDLQNVLTRYSQTASNGQKDLARLIRFEGRLEKILKRDGTIGHEIERHRDGLRKHMAQLKQGKTAIQGYRPADSGHDKPRVLSINR